MRCLSLPIDDKDIDGYEDIDDEYIDSDMLDIEKIRCVVLDCLLALRKVQRDK
jgi:hypothetical protein